MFRKTLFFLLTSLLFLNSIFCFGESKYDFQNDSISDTKLNELKINIKHVISQHQNLKVGIALLNEEGNVWLEVLGNSDQEIAEKDTENTMFRIASLSKMFVALSILKLQEEGKLNLEDEVKSIVPEVKFENQWEKEHPVRIIHLLEHTTGWDEIHLVEMVHNQHPPISLKDALEFHPHSRTSRWVPGTRMAYCNSGYAVAAYIVEKVTGLKYEDYVRESIFKPLMMNHSTFFNDQIFQKWGAEIYNWEMKEIAYKNELYRPSSALNSSINDISQILRLLLNRGIVDSLQFLKSESIDRMEIPYNSPGSNIGLKLGYGLGNQTSIYNNFTYHGHSGAMDGGLSELAYLPEEKIGHVILMNANNGAAMQEISTLIRDFETTDLPLRPDKKEKYQGEIHIEGGYYLAINPRNQDRFYQDLIFNIEKVEVHEDHLTMAWILPGGKSTYYPISPTEYTYGNSGKIGLVQDSDPLEGKVLYTDRFVFKPISGFRVFGQISILVIWVILMVLGAFIVVLSFILFLRNSAKYANLLKISILPTCTSLSIFLMFFIPRMNIEGADFLFATPSYLSIAVLLCSILFVFGSLTSAVILFLSKKLSHSKLLTWPIICLTCFHILVSVYLISQKVIPMITWS
jgi:CubicO group peptidase (beta-lactamase class C family)